MRWVRRTNIPFPRSTFVRTNNRTRARLGWTFSYISCIFVHSDLDSGALFLGLQERSIAFFDIFHNKTQGASYFIFVTHFSALYFVLVVVHIGKTICKNVEKARFSAN